MILIATPVESGYSFIIQATTLEKGLKLNNIPCHLVFVAHAEDLAKSCRELKPSVVISVGNWTDYDLLVHAPQSLGIRVVPWIVLDDDRINDSILAYNTLEMIMTPSEHCKRNLIEAGIQSELIAVVPEGIDEDVWYPIDNQEMQSLLAQLSSSNPPHSQRIKFDLADLHHRGVPILYTTGGDATKKGAQEVIRALATFEPELEWLYVIKTWAHPVILHKSIEELSLARSLGIQHRIRYLVGEFSPQFMRGLTNLCDIYTAPSREEGFGLPLVEAQMCGKPVVTMSATATQETVLHEQTGFLCKNSQPEDEPRADINDLAQHLEHLIRDKGLRQSMGRAARTHAQSTYSAGVVAQRMVRTLGLLA